MRNTLNQRWSTYKISQNKLNNEFINAFQFDL